MDYKAFKGFIEVAKLRGLLDENLQCAGYLWINLTRKQVEVVRKIALDQGFTPDKNGNIKVGNYTILR